MSLAAQPILEPGRTYRTRELAAFSANPTRLARRLVATGKLIQAAHGLFYAPLQTRFGQAPIGANDIIQGFLGDSAFVLTGPPRWNALGLGSTAMFASTLVYNHKRTGEFILDGQRFLLRRVLFPENPSPEWFVIDLLQHHDMAGVSVTDLEDRLVVTLKAGRWDQARLLDMAARYGTKTTHARIERCIRMAGGQ